MLKFSRSLYLCNHLSEIIHTRTIGTQQGPCQGGGGGGGGVKGQNLEHLVKVLFLCWSFLEVYIFATTFWKAFIVGPKVPYPTPPHPTPPLPYPTPPHPTPPNPTPPHPTLPHPLTESIHSWTKGTLPNPTSPHLTPPIPYPTLFSSPEP